jgi:beta-phosphoglucomutase-like phosphatase (HAD superfamily)
MTDIAAVIFDLDGVIVDATEWHYESLNKSLGLFGYTISRYEHLATYNGLPTSKKLEMLSVEKGLPRGLHGLIWKLKQKYTTEEVFVQCVPSFAKEFMTKRLRHDGYRLAVCSNAVRNSVELMLRGSGLIEDFEFYLSNEDVQHPKPAPDIYLAAFRRLGIEPRQAVIVEDAGPGIEAARRSGAHVCQVKGFDEVDYYRIQSFIEGLRSSNNKC